MSSPARHTPISKYLSMYSSAGISFVIALILLSGCAESPRSAQSQEGETSVHVAGADLFVETMGEGEPIIFVHGGPGLDHSYFLPHVRPLAEHNKLVFYDQRSSGRSDIGDSTAFSLDQFVEDIEVIRNQVGAQKIHLLGHSWGGLVAMRYALKHPDHLNSLILVNSNAASNEIQQRILERLQGRITPANRAEQTALLQTEAFHTRQPQALTDFFRLNFKPTFFDTTKVEQLSFYFDSTFTQKSAALGMLGKDTSLASYDLYADLEQLDVPTLIIHGSHDPATIEEVTLLQESIPESNLVMIEESGHFPFIEQPESFSSHIQTFLTNLGG